MQFETLRFSVRFLKFFRKNEGGEGGVGDRVQAWAGGRGRDMAPHLLITLKTKHANIWS